MKYYTFYERFHPAILDGVKHSTIRGKRKVQEGERFALRYWTGRPYRSKMGFLSSALCSHVFDITIWRDRGYPILQIDPATFEPTPWFADLDVLGRMEGFQDSLEMWKHFENAYGLPFSGVLTIWDPESFIEGDPSATAHPENPVHAV